MSRIVLMSALVAGSLAAAPLPVAAASAAAVQGAGQNCQQTPARQTRRSILGGIGGALVGRALGSNSVTSTIGSVVPVQSMLSDAIMNLLDCDEQQKAAQATEQLTERAERGGVGTSVEWRSETRPNVRGRSEVTAIDPQPTPQGARCMMVTDVVIVDGEETRVPKRMCRTPPSTRWARA
jgi:hypothetical protein